MPGNTFGELFRVTTAGVSHGPGYLVIIDGCPPGLPLSEDDLLPDLRRRRPGQSKIVTQRKEDDVPEIWSGVFEGKHRRHLDRHPLPQHRPAQRRLRRHQGQVSSRPRRLHLRRQVRLARLPRRRPLQRRETICRVAAGAVAKKLLARHGIRVLGYVKQVGAVVADMPDPTAVTLEQVEAKPVRCPDPAAAER